MSFGHFQVKLVDNLNNDTSFLVQVYQEVTGEIVQFASRKHEPNNPVKSVDSRRGRDVGLDSEESFRIVNQSTLQQLIESHRRLDNVAVVKDRDIGRDGELITRLVWAKDPNTYVRLSGVRNFSANYCH